MSGVIIACRCNYCSRQQSPMDLHRIGGEGGKLICRRCMDWHLQAMSTIATNRLPHACQECGITAQLLAELTGTARFRLVPRDGIYQILCIPCEREYILKRPDLYEVIDDARI